MAGRKLAAQTGALREDLEPPQDVAELERRTDPGGEDQAVLLPDPCGRASSSICWARWAQECLDRRPGEWHGPAGLVGLGLCPAPGSVEARN